METCGHKGVKDNTSWKIRYLYETCNNVKAVKTKAGLRAGWSGF
jgi:hypothetical protein